MNLDLQCQLDGPLRIFKYNLTYNKIVEVDQQMRKYHTRELLEEQQICKGQLQDK